MTMTLTDLLGNNDAEWMSDPRRGCAIDSTYEPSQIRDQADNWFVGERYEKAAAKKLCGGCPSEIKNKCLAAGMDEEFGIWGGLTPGQRRTIKRKAAAA